VKAQIHDDLWLVRADHIVAVCRVIRAAAIVAAAVQVATIVILGVAVEATADCDCVVGCVARFVCICRVLNRFFRLFHNGFGIGTIRVVDSGLRNTRAVRVRKEGGVARWCGR
jgi:hypothetical protein